MTTNSYSLFAIVSEPRTGSTYISDKLAIINNVSCQGEIFHPDKIYTNLPRENLSNREERNKNPINFLNEITKQTYSQKKQSKLIGFKLFFDHNPVITQHLLDKQIPVILLERRNKLKQYSSLKIAKKTNKWHSKQKLSSEQEELNKKQGRKINFSLIELIAFSIRSKFRFNSLIKKLKQNLVPYYYLSYENMLNEQEWANIITFLGIDDNNEERSKSLLKKQGRGDIYDSFENKAYAKLCCSILFKIPLIGKAIKG